MKKTYMTPELEAIELKINTTILAGSSLAREEGDAPTDGEDYDALSRDFGDDVDF